MKYNGQREYQGLLVLGDPHLASRVPGFRRDDYPQVILRKLEWCLDYSREHRLLPAILGDFFHWPRDNANWLLGRLLELLSGEVLGIFGNHDCTENQLGEDDSLMVIVRSGRVRLLDRAGPWVGQMGGRPVIVGGTSWGQRLPESFSRDEHGGNGQGTEEPRAMISGVTVSRAMVFWLAHHDVTFPGYEENGRFRPFPIPGIDVVINGHIHRALEDIAAGGTTWLNPGNIARIARSDLTRGHVPSALRIEVDGLGWRKERVEVPHEPYEAVFHPEVVADALATGESSFVRGLADLVARRTQGGAGLMEFLERNLSQFDERVAREVAVLAKEVLSHES
jgi:DNA repair exonuclease SbcCD nuclease subunit